MFAQVLELGWVEKVDDKWQLTQQGQAKGGTYKTNPRYGEYIAWPLSLASELSDGSGEANQANAAQDTLNSTTIGSHFGLSPQRINLILSELGWIEKGLKGWKITSQGSKLGGIQKEHPRSGVPFVVWPKDLLDNKSFLRNVDELKGDQSAEPDAATGGQKDKGFREKFVARHRTSDGHYVRSKAEMLIDNWLYMAEIVHAYERKLPVEEDVYCDFYIPTGRVYIEYWGLEDDPKYAARKKQKQSIYEKYGFNLIELNDHDVQNLDDVLPRLLLKFGVQSY